ncbi:unnamed protein product [Cylicocyclus nassatus]|uniref:Uncharacterized protein n=1 Tax=Cylicocyclus nassatus TaxID=53992 RepID=A0AA36M649_CYLNA|nr:unnamed protein product [Cylicocyclus nassatus]
MKVLTEWYEKIKRKLTVEHRKPSLSSQGSGRYSKEDLRLRMRTTSIVVLRPRADTEIIIERRRCSRKSSSACAKNKTQKEVTCRNRAESAPLAPLVQRTTPNHLTLVSTGSMLAPIYRSRTATIGKSTNIVYVG